MDDERFRSVWGEKEAENGGEVLRDSAARRVCDDPNWPRRIMSAEAACLFFGEEQLISPDLSKGTFAASCNLQITVITVALFLLSP